MHEQREFGLLEMSAIREMANIGLGHATTALATIIGRPFEMQIPTVETVALENIPAMIGSPEDVTVGVLMPVVGDLDGHIAFIFPWESAVTIWNALVGTSPIGPEYVDELSLSVMLEMGNIINGAFLNAIADMANMTVHATPPAVSVDLCHSITSSIVAEAELCDVVALAVETKLTEVGDTAITGYFLCIPSADGLDRLLTNLGVKEAA